MSETRPKTQIVHVRREQGEGGWFYATSPDLKGLLVTEPTLDGLDRAIPEAIRDLYAACGVDVLVTDVDKHDDSLRAWVAMPAIIAQQALAQRTERVA